MSDGHLELVSGQIRDIERRHDARMELIRIKAAADARSSAVQKALEAGLKVTEIARLLGVNRDTVYRIKQKAPAGE